MIFYRSTNGDGKGLSIKAVRALTTLSLAAYPIGGAIMTVDHPAAKISGLLVIAASLAFALPVYGSHVQKIVGEQVHLLDEFELKLRQRAMSTAYATFTALSLLAVLYFAIGGEAGLWIPRTYDHFNALFWGIFLYASLLPTFFLVWNRQSASELADSEDEPR
ncbi:hypothetical protein [Sphingomonas jaspsi]|uniref:hypothetical protein n=1 Tax=Sphingomonas jaspsi TaxID=392409 RepID=UPI0004B5263E|nr:hypothetical protein [Sphingomonas jaspsi]